MALRGPTSVLDKRQVDTSTHVVRDRLTRHLSPAKYLERYSYTDYTDYSLDEDEEIVNARIPQPYRTSFSAVVPPTRTKRDRSRSTSPSCVSVSSLKGSNRSRSKSPGGRRSNKHVTYDDRVVIRESGTSDSIVTNLSDRGLNDSSGHYSATSSMLDTSMSDSIRQDYSSELRELSQQIVREYSTSSETDSHSPIKPSHNVNHNSKKSSTPNGTMKSPTDRESRRLKENKYPSLEYDNRKKIIVKEDYENDRSVSYRVAIQNKYSDDVKQQAEEIMKEAENKKVESEPTETSNGGSGTLERSSSVQLEHHDEEIEKNRLTPSKRSISASIGNFFRRLSPHLGRKNKKGSNASSQSLAHGDDLDGSLDRHGSLSRGRLRRSFLKLVGKSKKGSKSLNRSSSSCDDFNRSRSTEREVEAEKPKQQTPKANLYMKSIEQSNLSDKEVYQKFKEKQTPTRSGEVTAPVKTKAVKASPSVTSPVVEAERIISNTARSRDAFFRNEEKSPRTRDVEETPKSRESASRSGRKSEDDSLEEYMYDKKFTRSEPSLLNDSPVSKQAVVAQEDEVTSDTITPTSLPQQPSSPQHNCSGYDIVDGTPSHRLYLSYPQMPIISDSAEFVPKEVPRTPSYLRISSAVSGYGHYSRYAAYKGIEKRSPYSSTLSLRSSRSDLATPLSPVDMPIGKIPNIQPPTNYPPLRNSINSPTSPMGLKSPPPVINGANNKFSVLVNRDVISDKSENGVNGHSTVNGDSSVNSSSVSMENGHVILVENFVSTGDCEKDGDFFLNVAQVEENRLLLLCSKCETEFLSDTIPEEACGKIRSAIGKANLLISQKFRQFSDLCHQHKHPDPDPESKVTKWEDLQGFWEMVKLQVDDVDEMFTEIDLMRQNGWQEIKIPSRRSSASSRSSPKSGSLNVSNASTPSHTPGSRRKAARMVKDTPESSPERSQKAKLAAKVREENRKKLLAEKRAAMRQQKLQEAGNVEIYVADNSSKSSSPSQNGEVQEEV